MRTNKLLRAITLTTPPISYDCVKKSLHVKHYSHSTKHVESERIEPMIETRKKYNVLPQHERIRQMGNNNLMKVHQNLRTESKRENVRDRNNNRVSGVRKHTRITKLAWNNITSTKSVRRIYSKINVQN